MVNLALTFALAAAVSATATASASAAASATTPAPASARRKAPVAPSAVVRPALSADSVKIGDVITLTIPLKHAADAAYIMPPEVAGAEKWGDFDILERNFAKTPDGSTFTLKIAAYRLGAFLTPELSLLGPKPVAVQRVKIAVLPTIGADVKDPALKSLRPPLDLIEENWTLLYVAIALGSLLLIAGIVRVAYRLGRKRGADLAPAPPPRPAHEIAYEKLDAIELENLFAVERVKEFYVRVGDVFREYLGNRYHFEALECTTRELLRAVAALGAQRGLQMATVESLLGEADLVKFAKMKPTAADGAATIDEVRAFIEATRELPEPPATQANASPADRPPTGESPASPPPPPPPTSPEGTAARGL
ncbi:MAG: hypothetical protein HYY84_00370 [Deltaproteobacteria bacterium]|nr:hypothetical protein [Deltaproteobacteria bacterium]